MTRGTSTGIREAGGSGEASLLVRGDLVLDPTRREVTVRRRTSRLTPLEYRLLRILAETPGRAFSRQELLASLHMTDGRTPVDRTLDNLVVRLRRKLGDRARRPVFIEAIWGLGYRFVDRAPSPAVTRDRLGAAAFDHLPAPAMIFDADRCVVLLNAAGRELWGVDAGDRVRRRCFDVVGCHTHRDGATRSECPGLEALRRGTPVEATYLTTTPRAADLPLAATYAPLRQEGVPESCMLVVRAGSG